MVGRVVEKFVVGAPSSKTNAEESPSFSAVEDTESTPSTSEGRTALSRLCPVFSGMRESRTTTKAIFYLECGRDIPLSLSSPAHTFPGDFNFPFAPVPFSPENVTGIGSRLDGAATRSPLSRNLLILLFKYTFREAVI